MYKYLILMITFNILLIVYLTFNYSENQSIYTFFLPISHLLCYFLFFKTYVKLKSSFVFNIFKIQCFFRYSIFPLMYMLGDPINNGYFSKYTELSILIMMVEIFLIHTVFFVFGKAKAKADAVLFFDKNIFIPIILILVYFYISSSGALSNINFVWEIKDYIENSINEIHTSGDYTLGVLLFNPWKVILFIYLLGIIKFSKYIKEIHKKWVYALLILIFSSVMVGVSRFSFILNFAVFLSLLSFVINEKDNRKVLLLVIPSILLIFLIATISKFYSSDYQSFSTSRLINASLLNGYFSGFGNISIGLEAYHGLLDINYMYYFINDIFQNIPILSKFTDDSFQTNIVFNEKIYGHRAYADQIVPLGISGLFHFGYIGTIFYTSFFIFLAIKMEEIADKVNFIGYKYVFTYLSLNLSLIFMLNLSSISSEIFKSLVFVLLPMFVIRLICKLRLK